jgi:hypothetical protein
MVEEAYRSNAGVVGPKLVDWEAPRQLEAVGMTIDRTGHPSAYVEPGEYDQGQHDRVREVFYVPGGCQLIRADLFGALGGFDPQMPFYGEDLDLCWRARAAGAKVVVAPQARVRHRAALSERRPDLDAHRLGERHRLRSILSCYSLSSLLWVVPLTAVLSVVELVGGLVTARGSNIRSAVGAWTWNLGRFNQLVARRRRLARLRRVKDRDLRALQATGFAQVTAAFQGERRGRRRGSAVTTVRQSIVDFARSGPSGATTIVWGLLGLVLILGSRHLLTRSLPAVGQLAQFPDGPSDLWREWLSGWRAAGLGSDAPNPTAYGFLGAWSALFLGVMGMARTAFVLLLVPLGGFGAWRMLRPTGSTAGRLVALIVYLSLPVAYNALAAGSLHGLVLYAAAPFLVSGLARASRLAPYGEHGASTVRIGLGVGLATGLACLFLPLAVALMAVAAVGLAAGCLLTGHVPAAVRVLGASVVATVVAVVLQIPWSLDFLGAGTDWAALGGVHEGAGELTVSDILRFASGPVGNGIVGFAVLVVAAVPVLIGRSWRATWAVRGWAVAVAAWGVLWVGEAGWSPVAYPAPEALLAIAGAGIALAAGMAGVVFERDVLGRGFSLRHVGAFVGGVALVISLGPFLAASFDGRWHLPRNDYDVALGFFEEQEQEAPFRVLWIGDPTVLPVAGWRLGEEAQYGTTSHGLPEISEQWAGNEEPSTSVLGEALAAASRRETSRLGRLLGSMGIRYVVIPERLAPEPFAEEEFPPPATVREALAAQLDLEQIAVNPAVTLYENAAWAPTRAILEEEGVGDIEEDLLQTGPRTALAAAAAQDLSGSSPALGDVRGPAEFRGPVRGQGELYLAAGPTSGWSLTVEGESAPHRVAFGWANAFDLPRGGVATLTYDTPLERYVLLALQAALWFGVLILLRRRPVSVDAPDEEAAR